MSSGFAASLILLGGAIFGICIANAGQHQWIGAIGAYIGLSLCWVGCGYAGLGTSVFGKRSDGRLNALLLIILAPYHLINCVAWSLSRFLIREPPVAELESNLWFGRRLVRGDFARRDFPKFVGCLDLTAEFSESPGLRGLPLYRCAPILDGTAPTENQLHELTDWLREVVREGPIFVHCAMGHGRTGCVLVAYLVKFQRVASVADAMKRLQKSRPQTRLNADQTAILETFARNCTE